MKLGTLIREGSREQPAAGRSIYSLSDGHDFRGTQLASKFFAPRFKMHAADIQCVCRPPDVLSFILTRPSRQFSGQLSEQAVMVAKTQLPKARWSTLSLPPCPLLFLDMKHSLVYPFRRAAHFPNVQHTEFITIQHQYCLVSAQPGLCRQNRAYLRG